MTLAELAISVAIVAVVSGVIVLLLAILIPPAIEIGSVLRQRLHIPGFGLYERWMDYWIDWGMKHERKRND